MKPKKRDIPKEVEVSPGIFYRIVWKRGLHKNGFCGFCLFDAKEIWISQGMSIKETLETLEHESLHALSYEWGFGMYHPTIEKLEEPLAFFRARNSVWIQWKD